MLAPSDIEPEKPLWQRLVWMAAIWLASVAVLGTIAWIIRLWLKILGAKPSQRRPSGDAAARDAQFLQPPV